MMDPTMNITTIANWGMKHPKPVQTILDAHAALETVQAEAPSWDGVLDPKTVAETVQAQAHHALSTGEAAQDAVRTARRKISAALVRAVGENLDKYIEQIEPGFNEAAEAYEQAVTKLPEEFTSEDVVKFDPETFQAYSDAKAAAAQIQGAKSWLQSLAGMIPGQGYGQGNSSNFLVIDPRSVGAYAVVQLADERGVDPAARAIAPTIARAVRQGGVLRLALPKDAKEDADNYEQQRQVMRNEEWLKLRQSLAL